MTELGPYRLREELAVGGMAEVFLAEHRAPADVRRDVVVKRVLPQFIDDPEFRDMFLDEARLMAALSHPYIAQVYDVGLDRGICYLVMEYIRGPTVRDLLAAAAERGESGLPRPAALSVVLAVAEALDYVHGRKDPAGKPLGIVHRDLNPANVMVAYTGAVKLIDFGIAKAASRLHQTRGNIVRGTRGYIAPEQISRDAPLDHRADIFAMGVLLYELCLGRHPFGDEPDATQLMRVVQGKYVPPERFDPRFPRPLSKLLRACFQVRPSERPRRMRDVVDAVAGYMRKTGESATLAELGDLASVLKPDPRPTAIAPPSARTRGHLARASMLGPDEMTEPSLILDPIDGLDFEDETSPSRIVPLGPEEDETDKVGMPDLSGPRRTRALDLAPPTPSGPPAAKGPPKPPKGPPKPPKGPPKPPKGPPKPPDSASVVTGPLPPKALLAAPPSRTSAPPSPPPGVPAGLPAGAPATGLYADTMSLDKIEQPSAPGPISRPTLRGRMPPPSAQRKHNLLLLVLGAVVLGLGSALVVLLLTR